MFNSAGVGIITIMTRQTRCSLSSILNYKRLCLCVCHIMSPDKSECSDCFKHLKASSQAARAVTLI